MTQREKDGQILMLNNYDGEGGSINGRHSFRNEGGESKG
jgi:hypothetical protein